MSCEGLVKSLYYSAFAVAVMGFVMEAWDIQHNVPFAYWLTGALALVTLLKVPYKICNVFGGKNKDWLPLIELLISLCAYVYLTYINIHKSTELKKGAVKLKLA